MREGWQTIPLGRLCKIQLGNTPARADTSLWDANRGTSNAWVSIADMPTGLHAVIEDTKEYIADKAVPKARLVPEGTLLLSFKLTLGRLCYAGRDLFTNEAIAALLDLDESILSQRFLYWYLTYFDWDKATEGDVKLKGRTLNKAKLQRLPILVPPLAEQKRIVAILDEAFEAIERAREATEATVSPLLSLVERERDALLFGCDGTPDAKLGDHIELLAGPAFKSTGYTDDPSGIPLLRGDNIVPGTTRWEDHKRWPSDRTSSYDRYWLQADDVVIAMDRPWISTGFKRAILTDDDVPSLLVQRVARLRCQDTLWPRFLYHLISSTSFIEQMVGGQTGTGVPHISGKQIETFLFTCPKLDTQRTIADRLDGIIASVQDAVDLRHRKLAMLQTLRTTLLRAAFSGELENARSVTSELANANSLPHHAQSGSCSIEHIAAVPAAFDVLKLHAGVIVLAYRAHQKVESVNTFGHLKAEKIAHMAEALGVIELHRQPTKQAAGPADLARFESVRKWAETNDYFRFVERKGGRTKGYLFEPMAKMPELIKQVSPHLDQPALRSIFNLFAPIKSDEAEVLATAYAAWNNLLLDGESPTDEEIVYAAREDWHAEKMKYTESQFKAAIRKLRKAGLVPDGSAKRVGEKPQAGLWDVPFTSGTSG